MFFYNNLIDKLRSFTRKSDKTSSYKPYVLYQEITLEQIDKFLAVHGNKGIKVLSLVGQLRTFKEAINSGIGRELLNDLMVKMELLLPKIIELSASKNELAEYRVMKSLMDKWSKKIILFEKVKKTIKEG